MMFYGVDGKRLAKCQIQEVSYPAYGYTFACTGITYFLGQVVTGEGESGGWGPWGAARDRLGSVRAAPYGYYYHDQGVNASSYFPYGQARTGGSVWATYQPSSVSGTMYAMNREYSAAYGRFLTPDPYMASGGVADPGSWNRYAYTQGDPVNYTDQQGLRLEPANDLGYEDPAGRSMFDAPYVFGGPGGGGYRTYGPLMAGTIYTTIPGASWDGVAGEGGTPLPGAPFNFDRGPAGTAPDAVRTPTSLKVVNDCYWLNGAPHTTSGATGRYTRQVEYQVLDQYGKEFYGSEVPTIRESYQVLSGGAIVAKGVWSRAENSILPNGIFTDYLHWDGATPTLAYQIFSANGGPGLGILGFGGIDSILIERMGRYSVTINGKGAPRPCGDKDVR